MSEEEKDWSLNTLSLKRVPSRNSVLVEAIGFLKSEEDIVFGETIPDIETRINEDILQEWTEMLPGCKRFLENFFYTCSAYPPEVNYLNYIRDLKQYAPTNRHIRENFIYLVGAFYEITGTTELEMRRRPDGWY